MSVFTCSLPSCPLSFSYFGPSVHLQRCTVPLLLTGERNLK